MKLFRRAAMSALAAVALVVGPAVAANAASISFDVTKLTADNLVVSDSNCKRTNVYARVKETGVDYWWVQAELRTKGGNYSSAFFGSDDKSLMDRVDVCPAWDGLGKYTIGPSEVNAYSYGQYPDYEYTKIERADYTKGSFYVRGKTYASLSAKRSGKTVTLTSTSKVYSPEDYGKVNYNPKVKFQVKSGGKWKTIKTVTAKKGKASVKVTSKSKKSYRVAFDQVSWATGATSATSKR